MKENLIQEISNAMTDVLSIEQMAQLNGVLLQVISKYTITKDGEKEHENAATNDRLLEIFLSAKQVEGCTSQLFYTTGIPVSLWFLNRAKKQTNKILFVDARNMGSMITRKLRELSEEDIMKIADTFDAFNSGTLENEKGYCAVVSIEDVAKQDYILTPGRYVGIAETEDDGEPFQEKMERLTSELSDLFAQSHDLEEEIRKQLSSIGFTIK